MLVSKVENVKILKGLFRNCYYYVHFGRNELPLKWVLKKWDQICIGEDKLLNDKR